MHQTRKGNQWYFGMKVHIGADAQSGLVHTLIGTAAHVHDVTQAQALLHGDETDVLEMRAIRVLRNVKEIMNYP